MRLGALPPCVHLTTSIILAAGFTPRVRVVDRETVEVSGRPALRTLATYRARCL